MRYQNEMSKFTDIPPVKVCRHENRTNIGIHYQLFKTHFKIFDNCFIITNTVLYCTVLKYRIVYTYLGSKLAMPMTIVYSQKL